MCGCIRIVSLAVTTVDEKGRIVIPSKIRQ